MVVVGLFLKFDLKLDIFVPKPWPLMKTGPPCESSGPAGLLCPRTRPEREEEAVFVTAAEVKAGVWR